MPKVIGINFRDNDFCNVAWGFLAALKHTGIDYLTKEKVVMLWNDSCGALYRLYQNQYEYTNGKKTHEEHTKNIIDYLQIKVEHVFFDAEVDKYLAEKFLNSEFGVIDCRNPHTGPYCYTT